MNNKSVAILTLYHDNHNYGGLLQSYALYRAISEIICDNHSIKQITYDLNTGYVWYHSPEMKIKRALGPIKDFYKTIKYGSYYKHWRDRCEAVSAFEVSIPHTEVVTAQTISKLNDVFDTFICGSDQIWNPIGWQDTLFLSFVKPDHKKIAYAASMARDSFTEEEAHYVMSKISDFDAVSLREEQSLRALQKWDPTFNAEIMPDPTMLLTTEEWERVLKNSTRQLKEPYIFAYFLGKDGSQKDKAIQYANDVGKKIFFINALDLSNKKWDEAHRNMMLDNVSVPDFLWLIKNADLVITDSFHGAVFSSIFQTDFVVLNRYKVGDKESMNSRLDTLMNILGINRISEDLDASKDYTLSDLEKLSIIKALSKQREKGINYLKKVLS